MLLSSSSPRLRIAVVGAGASGALLAAHLLRGGANNLEVILIEPREEIGRGLAYSTGNPRHLLNVRTENMSGFADDPDHFWRWLLAQGFPDGDRFQFVPRSLYGRYLGDLLTPFFEATRESRRLRLVRDHAIGLANKNESVAVRLASGEIVDADTAILACGHEENSGVDALHVSPWTEPPAGGPPPDSTVMILGTGLTMVDAALALLDTGHNGPIVAVSRRGLLPQAHRRVATATLDATGRPSGANLAKLCQWLRGLAREHQRQGGDWRSVVDGFRPYVQNAWLEMPAATRRRFLDHARPWWDAHRHRMAPEVEMRLRAAVDEGRLEIIAGKVAQTTATEEGARVSIRRRGSDDLISLDVSRIVSCRGVTNDPRKRSNPLLVQLLAEGLARADPLGIGLDVGSDCSVIDAAGNPSKRIFAIGPMSQAEFWEITAIPDIRVQAAALALRLKTLALRRGE
jgi:uncharacterized NAD(P)/FAD-binding protein YdhS